MTAEDEITMLAGMSQMSPGQSLFRDFNDSGYSLNNFMTFGSQRHLSMFLLRISGRRIYQLHQDDPPIRSIPDPQPS